MEVSVEDLRRRYESLADGDLINLYNNGELTETASSVLKDILQARGITEGRLKEYMAEQKSKKADRGHSAERPGGLVNLKKAGHKNMLYGALWCIGGIIVTALTYLEAVTNPAGGTYIIAWGAIVFGAIQFIRGLVQAVGKDKIQDIPGNVAATCPKCHYSWMGNWDISLKERQCPHCGEIWRVE